MKGDDVALLQRELAELGYSLPASETSKQYFGTATREAVEDFQRKRRIRATGVVNEPTAARINEAVDALRPTPPPGTRPTTGEPRPDPSPAPGTEPEPTAFIVRGSVRHADGTPVTGATVRAVDKELRREHALGEATTGTDGNYEIAYAPRQFGRVGKTKPDLVVRAVGADGRMLAQSPVLFRAEPAAFVDLVVGGRPYVGRSEYDRHAVQLQPLVQDAAVTDLSEEDVALLTGQTDIPIDQLTNLVAAAKLARETGLAVEVFYGLLREGLPSTLDALLAQRSAVHRRALESAVDGNVIPERIAAQLETAVDRLRQLTASRAEALGAVLESGGVSPDERERFADRYLRNDEPIDTFWADLRNTGGFDVDRLQRALRLGQLTDHPPLVAALGRRHGREWNELRDLALWDAKTWTRVLAGTSSEPGPGVPSGTAGADDNSRISNYAATLTQRLDEAFPTAAVARHVAEDQDANQDVKTFFKRAVATASGSFDLATTYLERYLADHPRTLDGVRDKEDVRHRIKGMQRLFKLTPRYSELSALHGDGLDSARRVTRLGRQVFLSRYATRFGGVARAAAIYDNAEQVAATALVLAAQHGMATSRVGMYALADHAASNIAELPDWRTLFGSPGSCDCEHCQSVYSPAAYLVDLLAFLDHRAATDGRSAKDFLFLRRPDLGDLELSCENTNTPLPYVDLVNEALENTVAPLPESDLRKRQTSGSPAERAATPQFINTAAYDVLKKRIHPWNLPFDPPWEEARAYLRRLDVSRDEVIAAFHSGDRRSLLENIDICREYLNLTAADARALRDPEAGDLDAVEPGIWNVWGFTKASVDTEHPIPDPAKSTEWITSGDWIDLVTGRADVFLQQSGLRYRELLDLLECDFINKAVGGIRPVRLESADPESADTCDPARLRLAGLTQTILMSIAGFVRLWRRTGWSLRDLDAAATTFGIQALDDGLIRQLSHIERLRREFSVPVSTVLSWWHSDRRHEELAKALKLSIGDYTSLRSLISEPFNTATDAVLFVEDVRMARSSAFSIAELEYLLRDAPSAISPSDAALEVFVNDLDAGLQRGLGRAFLEQTLAVSLNLDVPIVRYLIENLLPDDATAVETLRANQFELLRRFYKLAVLIGRWQVDVAELPQLLESDPLANFAAWRQAAERVAPREGSSALSRLLIRLGLSEDETRTLAVAEVTAEAARVARSAVRAKHDDAAWLELEKSIRNELRAKQRDALAAYLVARPDRSAGRLWRNTSDLYAWLLIDVEMDPCMMTSRLKQAISSVQLFTQRCLMYLEPGVDVNAVADDAWLQWKWMKNYRVWEANRKIFLYPENSLEPDLRDGKSVLFENLERDLQQNDLTHDVAETAFLNYLEQLATVAHLEICAFHRQVDDDGAVLHVFGRTRNTPHLYYYRRRLASGAWTAWEKVDLDIEGDHLIPVTWNRRLYLFWPVFTEQQEDAPVTMPSKNEPLESGEEYWEVQLAWSQYKTDGWSPRTLSKEKSAIRPKILQRRIFSEVTLDGDDLAIVFKHAGDTMAISSADPTHPVAAFDEVRFQFVSCGDRLRAGSASTSGPFNMLPSTRQDYSSFSAVPGLMRTGGREGGSQRSLTLADRDGAADELHYTTTLDVVPRFTVHPEQFQRFTPDAPLFYADDARTFLVLPGAVVESAELAANRVRADALLLRPPSRDGRGRQPSRIRQYRFETFYHPFACLLIKELNRRGIDAVLDRELQLEPHEGHGTGARFDFVDTYEPRPAVIEPYPQEDIDFSFRGAYSLYNWEVFFHAPLLIADRLSKNQRFDEAQRWFHYIFDPTDTSGARVPQRYWRTRPFYETSDSEYQTRQIDALLRRLASGESDLELSNQVAEWRRNPFNPHLVARLRPTAYQKNVVMKYIDNLIAWGDQLFRRDTIESINEATQLYLLASDILGPRPASHPPRAASAAHTYNTLEPVLDDFSNALVAIENLVPAPNGGSSGSAAGDTPMPTLPTMLYFCVPRNDKLWRCWDVVADRLFKIRHCMNIEGVVRQLPLFEAPLDEGLLARAAAAGVDIRTALDDDTAPLPHYRFQVLAQKASELCADLKGLGAALLAALEKRDAEGLSRLRSSQELQVVTAVRQIRERQVEEAKRALEGLKKARDLATIRRGYYEGLEFMNPGEQAHLALMAATLPLQKVQWASEVAATIMHLIPETKIGGPTTAGLTTGGENLSGAIHAFSSATGLSASILSTIGSMSATLGGYQRRRDEWKLQERLAAKEIEQLDKQILGAEIRVAIAERERENHELQTEHAAAVDAFMREKYTNRELYDWMSSQIASVYFQSYELAYDVARRAERAYRHELGIKDSAFIEFGYWDTLKKGLLAGERLYHSLKRLESAYLDRYRREFELTKSISLAALNPEALLLLKATGRCDVDVEETLFDMDYPGHYMRRLKSVSVTIPCVVGPYTSVNCTLTLGKNSIRVLPKAGTDVGTIREHRAAVQSIATSTARDDAGVFELNFRDERYLPFEGAGAISRWTIDMPPEFNYFDFRTISDVVLHLRYTALNGEDELRNAATNSVRTALSSRGQQLIDVRHVFSTAWRQFLQSPAGADRELVLTLKPEHFPFYARNRSVRIKKLMVLAELADAANHEVTVTGPNGAPFVVLLERNSFGAVHMGDTPLDPGYSLGDWKFKIDVDARELFLIIDFETEGQP